MYNPQTPKMLENIVIFWPSTRPKNAIPRWCTGRKWHIPIASNRKRSRGRIKADNMGQGEGPTVPLQSDATGREWPLNCMTVISAWWRLKHSISKIEWASNDYITQLSSTSQVELKDGRSWRRDVVRKATPGRRSTLEALVNWGPEKMLKRCSKESQHPAEWTPGPPVEHQGKRKTQHWRP